jgi:hypothetical protein
MLANPPNKPVSFKYVVSHGTMRILFLTVVVVLAVAFAFWAIFVALAPTNIAANTESGDFNMEVKDTTEQPVEISVSHTFDLTTSSGSMEFDVADGIWVIYYNISISTSNGDGVFGRDSSLMAPITHTFSIGATHDSELKMDTFDIELASGKYIVRIEASHPVDLKVTQKYKYQSTMDGMLGLGILFVILLIGVTISAMKKLDALRRSQAVAAFGAPAPLAPAYVASALPQPGTFAPQAAGPGAYGAPPAPLYPATPTPSEESARRSSLEYVPPQFYAEFVCTNCGWSIRNPPVNGVITCDRCGETGRLY